ncbi:putative redox protein [Nitrosomonas sp. PY1]|uniref:bifunctional alpha/beta hydrolase/OsmC family protein n=1 Tax=Nitrosomonas sp. PY1 TaxID=1803906 RepID=UPI001FC81864|nr:bifunctional alpha/beta hydrolase/OsmC family protein [Nitrosomonas sp. PY1]GKS69948.1 putative redox protein [Nitrosomonas sp. PY1]
MSTVKVEFKNLQGDLLSGLLETPSSETQAYALFAHCFTCSKNSLAAARIAKALADQGIAVLRFDFTGIGNSEGDFSDTNFSSNLEDLIAAADYLEQHYAAPELLIGHSLGGAAVLAVAQKLPSVKAVSTIGAPATAQHVQHIFPDGYEKLKEQASIQVKLGDQRFKIHQQFFTDLENYNSVAYIEKLRKALLIFHSPLDNVVSIDEAARIYSAAKHPKSFVSLDQADHLLTRPEDSSYVAVVLASWASRYLTQSADARSENSTVTAIEPGTVIIREYDKKFTREILTQHHRLISDEPIAVGGSDLGLNPYELLLSALGSCTSMTLRMYANHKNIDLQDIQVELRHNRVHTEDCINCDKALNMIDIITRKITLKGELDQQHRKRLLEIANRCPVHKTLQNKIQINTELAN